MKAAKILTPLAALAMAALPITAQAQPVRASAPVKEAEFQGLGTGALTLAGVLAALVVLVILASDDSEPASP